MVTVNRKDIENFYEEEWIEFLSPKAVNVLVELTCQSYYSNQQQPAGNIKKETQKPQNLGQI